MKNYYLILGLKQTATLTEIKRAYRKLALKFHPDKNPDDSFFDEHFKQIEEAHQNLIDETKRKAHDAFINGKSPSKDQNKTIELLMQKIKQLTQQDEKMKIQILKLTKENSQFELKIQQLQDRIQEQKNNNKKLSNQITEKENSAYEYYNKHKDLTKKFKEKLTKLEEYKNAQERNKKKFHKLKEDLSNARKEIKRLKDLKWYQKIFGQNTFS